MIINTVIRSLQAVVESNGGFGRSSWDLPCRCTFRCGLCKRWSMGASAVGIQRLRGGSNWACFCSPHCSTLMLSEIGTWAQREKQKQKRKALEDGSSPRRVTGTVVHVVAATDPIMSAVAPNFNNLPVPPSPKTASTNTMAPVLRWQPMTP